MTLDLADGRSLRSGFVAQAQASSDRIALSVGGSSLSYGELDELSRRWATLLLNALDQPPRRVGVLGYRSVTSYAGALSALLAGSAFVPLNPSLPPARTASMLQLADLDALIVERRWLDYLDALNLTRTDIPILVPDGPPPSIYTRRPLGHNDAKQARPVATLPPVSPSGVAYLLFTSGSTGVPKGVPVMHSNVLHFLDVMQDRYRLTVGDRLSQTFDQSFDLSVFDLFMAWQVGASVHVPSPLELVAPTAFIRRHELTVWFSVPSIPALMRKKKLLTPNSLPTLRWSLFCGEPLPEATAHAWQEAAPQSVVENLYGPTELTIACFVYRWDSERSPRECVGGLVPIGRPNPGLGALVRDENGLTVEDQPGELLVCGPQAVPGYWRLPTKTDERFITLPVDMATSDGTERFYATGDRVVRNDQGTYCYLGRTDYQIKVLGHRVELGEIETALRKAPGVLEAIALGWPIQDGLAEGVVAFLTGELLDATVIIDFVRERLPSYMVPQELTIIDEMPLNINGKIDRGALRDSLEARERVG